MRPVLVVDSGLGGLSVLRALRAALPARAFVYLADDAAFPYGAWDAADLERRVVEVVVAAARRHDPAIVVLACNTASTVALPGLRAALTIPVVGTVPAIKPAAERSRSRLVSVVATPGTVRREYTRELIARFAAGVEVTLHGAARLAEIAEASVRAEPVDPAAIAAEIAPCFVEKDGRRTDIVVLACTHFPLILPRLVAAAPWPVDWLDPAPAIARRAVTVLAETDPAPAGPNPAGPNPVVPNPVGPNPDAAAVPLGFAAGSHPAGLAGRLATGLAPDPLAAGREPPGRERPTEFVFTSGRAGVAREHYRDS
jgi:glutamate racemase